MGSTQYQYEVWRAKRALDASPDARNPEGASAETFALSGFPLLPELQGPEGPGLPVKARYRLSVVPALSVSCLTASPSNVDPPHPNRKRNRSIVFATTNPDFATPKMGSTQYQYEVRRAKRAPDARNPEGASAETFALSGFPLLPELQGPEGPGLPVKARYRLSVVPALSVSCLTASPSNVGPPHPNRKRNRSIVFATTNPDFATRRSTQYPVRSTASEASPTASPDARNPEGASAEAFALSGFSLPPKLQDPEEPGLPEGTRSSLSTAAGPLLELPPQRHMQHTSIENLRQPVEAG